jgi:hypothetical protein
VPRDCAVPIFEWELSYSVACGREVTRRRSRAVGFAAEEWVARCTAPGLKWTAQRVDRMGASWRDQTFPHSLEECDCIFNQLMVANGIVNFSRYISSEIAPAGLAKFRPHVLIFAARQRRF